MFVGVARRACGLLAGWRATPRVVVAARGWPVPARCPRRAGRDRGRRRGSRRAGCTPGRCAPARRCVIPAPSEAAGMVPPPLLRAAMLAAATRSRCPWCPQCGQRKLRPAGLGTRRRKRGRWRRCPARRPAGQRSRRPRPCRLRARIRCPTRQSLVRWLCRRPAPRLRTPRGSPTASVPTLCSTAQDTTVLAASCWAWRTRRRCRASAARSLTAVLPPAAGPALLFGGAAGGGPGAALTVAQVLPALGAGWPARKPAAAARPVPASRG